MDSLIEAAVRFVKWLWDHFNKRVTVRRVVSPDDRDLERAWRLYRRRLPENECDSFPNIVRWLGECQELEKTADAQFRDYLLFAKAHGEVCGLFYGTYYVRTRLLLVAYLVNDPKSKVQDRVIPALFRYLRQLLNTELSECMGVAFEIQHYAYAEDAKHAKRCRARAERLQGLLKKEKVVVKPLCFAYRQPRLSLWDPESKEEIQILMYARTKPPEVGESVPKSEVANILDTMYNDWYGDCYEDVPQHDAEYRAYVRRIYEETAAARSRSSSDACREIKMNGTATVLLHPRRKSQAPRQEVLRVRCPP